MERCQHGYIALTCPTCRGRRAAVPGPGPAAAPRPSDEQVGGDLEERALALVERTGQRDALQYRAFWQQVNQPTTVAEHDAQHRSSD